MLCVHRSSWCPAMWSDTESPGCRTSGLRLWIQMEFPHFSCVAPMSPEIMGHLWVKIQTVQLGEWWTVKDRRVCHVHGFVPVTPHTLRFIYVTHGGMKLTIAMWNFNQLVSQKVRVGSQVGSLDTKAFEGSGPNKGLIWMLVLAWFSRTVTGWLACTWQGDSFFLDSVSMCQGLWHDIGDSAVPQELLQDISWNGHQSFPWKG